jgi:hypothetical protein
MWEQFDDTKGAIWSRKTKNGQKKMEKQRSTKHYIEPKRYSVNRPNSPSVFSGVRVTRSFGFYVMFCRSLFLHFLLAILRFTASNCSFGIVKLFSHYIDCLIKDLCIDNSLGNFIYIPCQACQHITAIQLS